MKAQDLIDVEAAAKALRNQAIKQIDEFIGLDGVHLEELNKHMKLGRCGTRFMFKWRMFRSDISNANIAKALKWIEDNG